MSGRSEIILFCLTLVWLGMLSYSDLRRREVPFWQLIIGMIPLLIGIFFSLTMKSDANSGVIWKLGGLGDIGLCLVPGGLFLLIGLMTGKAGMADGIVLCLIGGIWGVKIVFLTMTVGLFLSSVCSILLLISHKAKGRTQIPFLPFLAVAWLLGVYGKWGGCL